MTVIFSPADVDAPLDCAGGIDKSWGAYTPGFSNLTLRSSDSGDGDQGNGVIFGGWLIGEAVIAYEL